MQAADTIRWARTGWVIVGLLALVATGPAAQAALVPTPPPDPQSVTVSIPDLAYAALDDVFRVGPFVSLLDVLANDAGPRDRTTLQLLDDQGRPVTRLQVPRVGVFTVQDGYLRLEPVRNPDNTVTVRYRAASPQGGTADGRAVVLATRAISAVTDRSRTNPTQSVTVPIGSNDTLLITGAYRVCGPRLSATAPTRPDVVVVVPPEPGRPQPRACPPSETLTTTDGTWRVNADGTVTFTPAAGARGAARIWYSQDIDYPFDIGTAQIVVVVASIRPTVEPGTTPSPTTSPTSTPTSTGTPGTATPTTRPGGTTGPGGDGTGDAPGTAAGGGTGGGGAGGSASGGGPGGPLAFTGAELGQVLGLAGALLASGVLVLLVVRRRSAEGGPRFDDGTITHHGR